MLFLNMVCLTVATPEDSTCDLLDPDVYHNCQFCLISKCIEEGMQRQGVEGVKAKLEAEGESHD
jgi:hypothetical protein